MKLLMIAAKGDSALVQGKKGPFYYMLEEFSKYWERIDIICPSISISPGARSGDQPFQLFNNVFIHLSPWSIIFQPWFILKKGLEIYKKEKFNLFIIHGYPPFYNDIGGRLLYLKLRRFLSSGCSHDDTPHSSLRFYAGQARLKEVPYILETMHITGYPKAGNFKQWFYKILTRYFIKFFAKNAKAVRVINKKETPEFLKKAGVDEKKLKYIPAFYIDFDVFKPQDLPKKYDIVFSGRLVKNKGIQLLLSVIERLKLQNPNIKLVIVGSGPLKSEIKKYIKRHKLEKNVEITGWLPSIEDLIRIYNQSKIFVMPSFNEGGPRVNLEAMACKIPVITSKVGAMLDIINPSTSSGQVNGLFVDWDSKDIAEKINLLLEDKELYKKIAENGYKTVQQFERRTIIKNYAKTYQNLLHSS